MEARKGGAGRIELCDNFTEGGTTPSYGTILVALKHLQMDLFVIIRPRGGDFLYSDIEFEVMKQDILFVRDAGVKGVVFGILSKDGKIDIERNRQLLELAKPMQATFHRAFDMTDDPFSALEDIITIGFDRILTSGQKATAIEGADTISKLVKQAGNRIIIMPGSGINEENILELAQKTGAKEFHASLRKKVKSNMKYRNNGVYMGIPTLKEYEIEIADYLKIKRVKDILSSFSL
jgi:copper homeostasis protein